jgi:hypothetical protein
VPDTAELFASLKRETDEINALKANKTPRRQIISNWARYEEPLPGPDHEAELQGADFETLLKAPVSGQMVLSVVLRFISVSHYFLLHSKMCICNPPVFVPECMKLSP